ncbi:MAG TPA: hypothetical protein VGO00_06600, partial [Kofleriaceae bacterium]|nr:hypothetical protein [Kofleriaceae bacterium]
MTTHLTTAADALRDEEVERTRAFLQTGWVVALGVVAMTLAVPGDRRIAEALIAVVGVGVVASVVLHRKLRDPLHFDRRELGTLAVVCVLGGQLGILYVGYFSAAPAVTVLGIYFFCRTESSAAAVALYAVAAGGHLVEAVLVIAGVIDDPGFYHTRPVSVSAQVAGHFVVQCGYLLGFVMARIGRTASLASIEALQEATRLAAQREEQVNELRQDLDRALKIGGPGRFTGHVVGVWELGTVLGRGAMGEVYEAVHVTTREAAAVK